MRRIHWAGVLTAMFLMVSAGWGEEFSWSGSLPAGSVLTIRSVRGDIMAEPSTGDRIEVSGHKKGNLQVRVIEEAGKVTICTLQPGNDRCPGGRDKRRDHEMHDTRIDFKIRIPAGIHLVADTEVGKVEARGLSSPIEARTVLGNIDISTSAYARAESVNGDIRATLGKTDWDGSLNFKTVNGNIVVRLPDRADTELRATSTTGRFESDLFPYEKPRYGIPGVDVSGKLGKGGRTLKISTTNGSIRLEGAS